MLMIEFLDEGSTYVCYCLVQAGRETGPVVKVDDVYRPVGRDDGISAIDVQPQQAGGLGANVLKVTFSERVKHRGSVDEFMTEFVEFTVLGVTPEEKRLASHSIKFYQVACQMFCYNPPFNAPSAKAAHCSRAISGVGAKHTSSGQIVCMSPLFSQQAPMLFFCNNSSMEQDVSAVKLRG